MPLLHARRNRRTAEHRPATPSTLEGQIHKELRGIPEKFFPMWGKPFGERYQAHLLLLPESCEQGLLRPGAAGYTYEVIERIECDDTYCIRYTNAIQTRSQSPSTGRAETEANPPPVQDGIGNQRDHVRGQREESMLHPGDNPIQHWETVPYTMPNPPSSPQFDFYPAISSMVDYQAIDGHVNHYTDSQHSMDTSSDVASGFQVDLRSPSPLWDLDLYDQVHQQYGHHWASSSSPPPRG